MECQEQDRNVVTGGELFACLMSQRFCNPPSPHSPFGTAHACAHACTPPMSLLSVVALIWDGRHAAALSIANVCVSVSACVACASIEMK